MHLVCCWAFSRWQPDDKRKEMGAGVMKRLSGLYVSVVKTHWLLINDNNSVPYSECTLMNQGQIFSLNSS